MENKNREAEQKEVKKERCPICGRYQEKLICDACMEYYHMEASTTTPQADKKKGIDLVELEKKFDEFFKNTSAEEFWELVEKNRARDGHPVEQEQKEENGHTTQPKEVE